MWKFLLKLTGQFSLTKNWKCIVRQMRMIKVGSVLMKVLLELIRIAFIFLFFGGILSFSINYVYSKLGTNIDTYGWMGLMGILILIFILYRNKFQFSGWYTGKGREKLPQKVSILLTSISIFLLISPPVLSSFLS